MISAEGQPFHDPEADAALPDAIRDNAEVEVEVEVEVTELDTEINSPEFAAACPWKHLEQSLFVLIAVIAGSQRHR